MEIVLLVIVYMILKLASDKGAEIQAREQVDKWNKEKANNDKQ